MFRSLVCVSAILAVISADLRRIAIPGPDIPILTWLSLTGSSCSTNWMQAEFYPAPKEIFPGSSLLAGTAKRWISLAYLTNHTHSSESPTRPPENQHIIPTSFRPNPSPFPKFRLIDGSLWTPALICKWARRA
ncbi:hypothetical protein DFH07DRAFT_839683 [Mycena maculata]|uniref:Secreted protein n=1 Tax=Mycena maculata TaxID=230809 RepID=A0AAD7ICM9_9AGAR|nr:hypothetical protein DFH07DRAFT_839683 [Mycena maculata]